MPRSLQFVSLAHSLPVRRSRPARAKDTDWTGPLRVLVGAGILGMLYLAFRASSPFPSDAFPSEPDQTKGY